MFNKNNAELYFMAEKNTGLLLTVFGLLAVAIALVLFLLLKTPLFKGMAIPLFVLGLLPLVAGYTVYNRSDAQRKDVVYKLDMNPEAIKSSEIPRMQQVVKNFTHYRWAEIGMLLAGIALLVMYRSQADKAFFFGLGIGLAAMAFVLLLVDFFAEKRAIEYLTGLQQWIENV